LTAAKTSPSPAAGSPPARLAPSKPVETEELVDLWIHRPLAARVVRWLLPTPITPAQVTLAAGLVGLLAGAAYWFGAQHPIWRLAGAGLLCCHVILDCADGQLARARGGASTYGAILDGLVDYVVGIAVAVGASHFMATVYASGWYWLLGLAGTASIAAHSALFDHTKTRYIARVGGGYVEREDDLEVVVAERRRAWQEHRWRDAALLWIYERYTRTQQAALRIPPVRDPAAWRAAHRSRLRAWSFLGVGTHLFLGYLCGALSFWWPGAIPLFFLLALVPLNLLFLVLLGLEARARAE